MVFSHNDDQYETEDSDEYSDDDEEEEVQLKPIFIPKVNRTVYLLSYYTTLHLVYFLVESRDH